MKLCSADWLGLMAVRHGVAARLLGIWKSRGDVGVGSSLQERGGIWRQTLLEAELKEIGEAGAAVVWRGEAFEKVGGFTTEERGGFTTEARRALSNSGNPGHDCAHEHDSNAVGAGGQAGAWRSQGIEAAGRPRAGAADVPLYVLTQSGVAVISMAGVMMKNEPGKYSGSVAVTKQVRLALAEAEADPAVKGIVLRIDSPGGTVSGTDELATAIASATKPVIASVEDQGASAAYWAASQADAIVVNRAGYVGSLGVFTVIYDTSAAMEAEGIKAHLVSTGGLKGQGADGLPVSGELLGEIQAQVDEIGAAFRWAVVRGRRAAGVSMSAAQASKLFTGAMFSANKALELGLVDRIGGLDVAVKMALAGVKGAGNANAKTSPQRHGEHGGNQGGARARAELRLRMAMGGAAK